MNRSPFPMNLLRQIFALVVLATLAVRAAETPAPKADVPGKSQFVFTQAGKNVTVWLYVPPGATAQSPVVVVMHGVKRNGEDYLTDWTPLAAQRGFLLVVPEFSQAEFPKDDGYILGNTLDAAGKAVPRDQWAFSMIEPVFDAVKQRTGNRSERYRLFGHSAGAQFVHRFLYFVPTARVSRIVSANAGWYTLPDLAVDFPYGLKGTPVTAADLHHALGLPVTVLLGEADIDPKAAALRHTPEAEAQGPFRFARGKFFFARAEEAARAAKIPFAWKLATAPGIGHSDQGMAPFGVKALFPE